MSKLTRYTNPVDELFRGFFVKPMDLPSDLTPQQIKMDVKEQDKSYEVHAEIPGVKKEDIDVRVDGNTVTISAEVKSEKEEKGNGDRVLRRERQEGYASSGGRFGLSLGLGLHHFTNHLEAGRQVFLAHPAWRAIEGIGQTGNDRQQIHARWRVLTQLVAQLTANAVANACFVGGQFEFGHATAPLEVKKGRPD